MEIVTELTWICPICKVCLYIKTDTCLCKKFNRRLGPMDGPTVLDPKYEHEKGFCRGSICLVCSPDSSYRDVEEWHKSGKCHEYEKKNFGTTCRLGRWH